MQKARQIADTGRCGGYLALAMLAIILSGCGGTEDAPSNLVSTGQQTDPSGSSSSSSNSSSASANAAPAISGKPSSVVNAGVSYQFKPSASDSNGDQLTFSIQNKPSWATFNTSNGTLAGTPTAGDVNNYPGIVITVSDGKVSASLAAFSISVNAAGNGRATVSWMPPTQNTDGTALTNLAGYKVLYGTNSQNLSQTATISNPSLSTYVVESLAVGTWYFAIQAYTAAGAHSEPSSIGSKAIL